MSCTSKKGAKKQLIYVKLPDMQIIRRLASADFRRCYPQDQLAAILKGQTDLLFKLSISSSKAFTLLGLVFTQAGNYAINFDGIVGNFITHEHALKGYLQTPVQYKAGQWMTMLSDVGCDLRRGKSFTHVEHVKGDRGYIEADFTITVYGGRPPCNTLIIQL